jgi:hypothetical protein
MTNHIELRLPHHENVYVARICGRSKRYRFERDFDCVRRKREAAELDGVLIKNEVVYYLPLLAAVYEVRDEQGTRYYIGTRPGDPALYEVSLPLLEALIDNDPDLDEVIGSKIGHFRQAAMQRQETEGEARTGDQEDRSGRESDFAGGRLDYE